MASRSRYLAASSAATMLLLGRRRARRRNAARGIQEALVPTADLDLPTEAAPGDDEAHARGHHHLPLPDASPRPLPAPTARRWAGMMRR